MLASLSDAHGHACASHCCFKHALRLPSSEGPPTVAHLTAAARRPPRRGADRGMPGAGRAPRSAGCSLCLALGAAPTAEVEKVRLPAAGPDGAESDTRLLPAELVTDAICLRP